MYRVFKYTQLTHDRTYHRKASYLHLRDRDIAHMFYNRCIAMHTIGYVVPYPMLNLYRMDELKIIIVPVSSVKGYNANLIHNINIYRFHYKYHIESIFHACYVYLKFLGTSCTSILHHPSSSRFPCPLRPWSIEILLYLVYLRWRTNCSDTSSRYTHPYIYFFIYLYYYM